ncbi:MAG: hypothetical protein IKX33_02305 [Prevotella sp.]|nr:hypothetical protein [Prevotella sp.]
MSKKVCLLCVLLLLCTAIQGQDRSQVKLLKKAYKQHSTPLLYQFFDNWSNAITSNENEAKSKWVAEAHKVFAAFYQPLQLDKIGCRSEKQDLYKNSPYFIVQDTLQAIYMADVIPITPDELEAYYTNRINQIYSKDSIRKEQLNMLRKFKERGELSLDFDFDYYGFSGGKSPTTKVDSAISFRPPVKFPNKKIVYLTSEYARLLYNFLGNRHVGLGQESIMQVAYSKGESRKRMDFINNAAKIFYGHWGGYWQYETYPKATSIVFDSQMQRAVVYFRFVYEGGEVTLEKQNGEWTIVSGKLTWIE